MPSLRIRAVHNKLQQAMQQRTGRRFLIHPARQPLAVSNDSIMPLPLPYRPQSGAAVLAFLPLGPFQQFLRMVNAIANRQAVMRQMDAGAESEMILTPRPGLELIP